MKPTLEQIAKFGAALDRARYSTSWLNSYEAEPIAVEFEAIFGDVSVDDRSVQKARATRHAVAEALARALVADDRDTSDALRRAMEAATRALALAIVHAAWPTGPRDSEPAINLASSVPPSDDMIAAMAAAHDSEPVQ